MADLLLAVTGLAAGAACILLALALVAMKGSRRAHRAFALLLGLQGMGLLLINSLPLLDPFWQRASTSVAVYAYTAMAPALVYFTVAFSRRFSDTAVTWTGIACLVAAAFLLGAYMLDHCASLCTLPDGSRVAGPLYLTYAGPGMGFALAGLLTVVAARRAAPGARRGCMLLVGTMLALQGLLDSLLAALTATGAAGMGAEFRQGFADLTWRESALYLRAAGILPALGALALAVHIHAGRDRARRRWLQVAAGLAVLAACSIAGLYSLFPTDPARLNASFGMVFTGLWRILIPAMVVYGLLKHQLFELDPLIKSSIRPTTVAVILLGAFFMVSNVIESLLDFAYGPIYGGLVAGLLLFALSPLERLGHRVAHALMPHTKSLPSMDEAERMALYRDQAALVWSDGVMRANERALLDRLRDRLGISLAQATELEREAFVHLPSKPARGARRRATD